MILVIFILLLLAIISVVVVSVSGSGSGSGSAGFSIDPNTGEVTITAPQIGEGSSDRDPTLPSETPSGYTTTSTDISSSLNPTSSIADLDRDDIITQDKLDMIRNAARDMAQGIAMEVAATVGIVVAATAIERIANEGLKSGVRTTGRLLLKSTIEFMSEFGGVVSQRAASRAISMATTRSLENIAYNAATQSISSDLAKFNEGKPPASQVRSLSELRNVDSASYNRIAQNADEAAKSAVQTQRSALAAAAAKPGATSSAKAASRAAAAFSDDAAKAASGAAIKGTRIARTAGASAANALFIGVAVMGLALDLQCCGGYCNVAGPEDYEKIRDRYNTEWTSTVSTKGERIPIIFGPFDKYSAEEQGRMYAEEIDRICGNSSDPLIQSITNDAIDRVRNGTITTPNQFRDYIVERSPEIGIQTEKNLCTRLDGKVIQEESNVYCSYKDQNTCESSFKWPISEDNGNELDTYVSWNSTTQECNKDPVSHNMRLVCELAEFPFNKETKSCDIIEDYCLEKAMDFDGKKCVLSEGQEACEIMFSTTICRRMRQAFESDQYEDCPEGSRPAGEIAALAGAGITAAAVLAAPFSGGASFALLGAAAATSTYLGQTMCANDNACPSEMETVAGTCYTTCQDSANYAGKSGEYVDYWGPDDQENSTKVQGMCYEKCPSGTYPTAADCTRNFQSKSNHDETPASCPSGYRRLTVPGTSGGPGDLCEPYEYDVGIGTPKVCQRTQLGYCHSFRPWVCSGGVREDIDGLCYNPCHPIGNSNIPCPTGTTNRDGWCIDNITGQRRTDYVHKSGMPYKCIKRDTSTKGVYAIGSCSRHRGRYPPGHYKEGQEFEYEKIDGMCYTPCDYFGQSWVRTPNGLNCILPADTTPRDSFARKPKGTDYRVFPKKRRIPYGTTENGAGCYPAGQTTFNPPTS